MKISSCGFLNWYNETKAKKEELLAQILHFIKQILL
jgi:hypothetical protein